MRESTSWYPSLKIGGDGTGVVSQAGAVALLRTAVKVGLDRALSQVLVPWRKPLSVHDPGKILLDLAVMVAIGGDCGADVALLRGEPEVFGHVASDPAVHRLISTLAADAPKALAAIASARAAARAAAWQAAGDRAPDHAITASDPLSIDLDATLLDSHSEKECAAPTYKKGYGFHPLLAFADHGLDGTGEPLAELLRPGNAGANTAADHKRVLAAAIAQLPWRPDYRVGRKVLVRTDSGGGTHDFVDYCTARRVQYSLGFTLTDTIVEAVNEIPADVWTPAYDADGDVRDGAWVAEVTDMLDLDGWPDDMRLIVRKERPHPGAQLRFTDVDGLRLTAFVTNTRRGQLPDLELRHRRRARCEDRIRGAKATGLRNLPFKSFDANRIWVAIVALALDLTAWLQTIGLHDHAARRWEPKTLRLQLFSIPARLARHARRVHLRLSKHHRGTGLLLTALNRLQPG
ncbi:IS1380 family transposase [Nocardia sp. CA-151230]|uniref:IS1380 family transposase n=1 Tax=Nocardia sp. CA-151230 TaxID=3239982 RepID=UPI003D9281AF